MSNLSTDRWIEIALILLLDLFLVLMVGPLILLAWPLQLWASKQVWDASDRWDTIKAFAVFFLLLAVPMIIFWKPFTHVWQQGAFLGPASFGNWWFRSFLTIFLVPAAALILERGHPRTADSLVRLSLPGEEMPPPAPSAQPGSKTQSSAQRQAPQSEVLPTILKKTKTSARSRSSSPSAKKPEQVTISMEQPKQSRDPRGENPYTEIFAEMLRDKPEVPPSSQLPAPPPAQQKFSWDEGEGTYSDKQ